MQVVQTSLVPGIIILLFQDWSDVKNVITRFAWGEGEGGDGCNGSNSSKSGNSNNAKGGYQI